METSDKINVEIERRDGTNNLDYSSSISTDWQLGDANSASTIGMLRQNTGFSGFSAQNTAGSSNTMGFGNINHASFRNGMNRPFDMMSSPPSLLPKGDGLFSPNVPVLLPQSLSEFPSDSGFIERAARFSCFGGGNFGDMINHSLGGPELMGLYSHTGGMMRGPPAFCGGNVAKSALCEQSPKNGANVCEPPEDPFLGGGHGKNENLVRSYEENKQNIPGSSNVSDEARSSGGNGQDEQQCQEGTAQETPLKGSNTKKRKRVGQDTEPDHSNRPENSDEAADGNTDNNVKGESNPHPGVNRTTAGKQGKQISDIPKEGYIHVRARRGQATNSHSLAERVRREKISERMKFLQDLVPGCNKVTGKAVMLDEIINYVQSLQRQVEFLSMKLATVNPGLDFNIEGLLAKEPLLHTRSGHLSCVPFPQDMPMAYPNLQHPSPPGLLVLSGTSNPSNFFPRAMNLVQLPPVSGGFKQQENHVWEGDLHNVIQMSSGAGVPTDNQDETGKTESPGKGNMKVEP